MCDSQIVDSRYAFSSRVNVSAGLSPDGSKPDAGVVSTITAELPTPFVRLHPLGTLTIKQGVVPLTDGFDSVFASRHRLLLYDEWEGFLHEGHLVGIFRVISSPDVRPVPLRNIHS